MTASEAASVANKIKPSLAIPMHYDAIVGSQKDAEEFKRLAQVPVEILEKSK
jgi:L-ascorbate metabolism protein UlaG (beta-lactamase superfamily)